MMNPEKQRERSGSTGGEPWWWQLEVRIVGDEIRARIFDLKESAYSCAVREAEALLARLIVDEGLVRKDVRAQVVHCAHLTTIEIGKLKFPEPDGGDASESAPPEMTDEEHQQKLEELAASVPMDFGQIILTLSRQETITSQVYRSLLNCVALHVEEERAADGTLTVTMTRTGMIDSLDDKAMRDPEMARTLIALDQLKGIIIQIVPLKDCSREVLQAADAKAPFDRARGTSRAIRAAQIALAVAEKPGGDRLN